jgi:hypothetical protein
MNENIINIRFKKPSWYDDLPCDIFIRIFLISQVDNFC